MKAPVAKAVSAALPLGAAAAAWVALEALQRVNDTLALVAGAAFLAVAIPVLLWGRK